MPIHFSIGFVVEQMPRRQFVTICATAVESDIVKSVVCEEIFIKAVWERRGAQCR